MKKYSWSVLYKTIVLGAYISAVNFYNCPFEERIEACDSIAVYNCGFLISFTLITKLVQLINICILSIQQQERDAEPVQAAVADEAAVEPKTAKCSKKIVGKTGKLIGLVGAITVFKALYTGFNAQSIATKGLGIPADLIYVTREQYALSDNLKVISFLQIPIGFILMSFWRASKVLTHGKFYWKCASFKIVFVALLAHAIKGFKVENHKLLGKEHHHCKGVMVLVAIILAHIFFARRVGKQAACVEK